jgi:hypothetical protein
MLRSLPVVDRANPLRLDGLITQFDLLDARQKLLEEERRAERILTLHRMNARGNGEQITTANEDSIIWSDPGPDGPDCNP